MLKAGLIDGKKIIDIKYLISPEVKMGDMTLFYAFIHSDEKETTLQASDY
jgi:hypothetical protein